MRVQLRGELEARPGGLGPPLEQLLAGQAVAGRVQLDGREALGVMAEEVLGFRADGVEVGPPGRIRPAGSADICPGYTRRGVHDRRSDTRERHPRPRLRLRSARR